KSASTVRKLLREQNATARMLNQSTAHVQLRSLYPNHVHQVDPSLCLIYYPPGGKKGRVQRFMSDDEFYKNKPENLEKIKNLRVWRYVLTDHYSGAVRVRYYESAGETMANLYDFLLWCWGLHNDEKCPMRGLPDILVMDKGSANTAGAVIRALDALSVDVIDHEVGRARAKGQVENANNLVEKLFESRLMFEPVNSVAELNERVIAWQN
ncbi:MAG: transposase family protein, partial [Alteromonas sp.]|nr:transposase family protein [Alteromonas sp.]